MNSLAALWRISVFFCNITAILLMPECVAITREEYFAAIPELTIQSDNKESTLDNLIYFADFIITASNESADEQLQQQIARELMTVVAGHTDLSVSEMFPLLLSTLPAHGIQVIWSSDKDYRPSQKKRRVKHNKKLQAFGKNKINSINDLQAEIDISLFWHNRQSIEEHLSRIEQTINQNIATLTDGLQIQETRSQTPDRPVLWKSIFMVAEAFNHGGAP